jgi:hypothetical protein
MQMFRVSPVCYVVVDGRRIGVWRDRRGGKNYSNEGSRTLHRQTFAANSVARMKGLIWFF